MTTNTTRGNGRGWAYTGATLGGLVSIAANVAHSFIPPAGHTGPWAPEAGAVVSAIVWPTFLFIAIEILARTPWPRQLGWALTRWIGLLPVALVAAFVSYRHLSGLLAHYGEEPIVTIIGPLAVDGLMIMATAALMATGHRRTPAPTVTQADDPADRPTSAPTPTAVPVVTTAAPIPAEVLDVPKHLITPARFAVTNHEQTTGRAITTDELASRMSISPATAGQLLTLFDMPTGTPSDRPINGTPVTTSSR
jgi:hypothetical protein